MRFLEDDNSSPRQRARKNSAEFVCSSAESCRNLRENRTDPVQFSHKPFEQLLVAATMIGRKEHVVGRVVHKLLVADIGQR